MTRRRQAQQAPATNALTRKLAAAVIALGALAGALAASPAQAAWIQWYHGTLAPNVWKWSGHVTNSGGWAEIQWPFSGNAYLMKSGSSAMYSGYQTVLVTWPSSYTSVACAHVSQGSVAILCRRQS